jgi:hypothetical protein
MRSEIFDRDSESHPKCLFEWCLFSVVQDILETLRNVWLPLPQVVEVRVFEKKQLIDRLREGDIQNNIVIDCEAHKYADKLEVDVGLMG